MRISSRLGILAAAAALLLVGSGCPFTDVFEGSVSSYAPPERPPIESVIGDLGGVKVATKPRPFEDFVIGQKFVDDLDLDECDDLPEEEHKLKLDFNSLMGRISTTYSTTVTASAAELDECSHYKPGYDVCQAEWNEIDNQYRNLFIGILAGKGTPERQAMYDKAKADYDACLKKEAKREKDCREKAEKSAQQAKVQFTTDSQKALAIGNANDAKMASAERRCLTLAKSATTEQQKAHVGSATVPTTPPPAAAADGKKYYVVKSTDPSGDTGNEVCAKAGKTCVGYTDFTLGSCLANHPGAQQSKDFNGSKAGFFCDGSPQGGICAKESNTCHICTNCNVNMDCSMEIGVLYRETYVECK